jgi:KDO2-lipid IV(A) lauroyltransferase
MDFFLYWPTRALIGFLQSLPLETVAHIGRFFGAVAYCLDARHRRKTKENLRAVFGDEKSQEEISAIASETFRRIGENFCCAVKTASMDWETLKSHCETVGMENLPACPPGQTPPNCIVAIGHLGNFELWARMQYYAPGFQMATTYRGLRQKSLNKLLQDMRNRSGCLYFERRTEGSALKAALAKGGLMLGILSDQHAGDHGLHLPFFGRICSTTAAPAVFALRYKSPICVGLCFRTGLGRWRLEIQKGIPFEEDGKPRTPQAIMQDVNRVFEEGIRRDPANWFWVHNRWKLKVKTVAPVLPVSGDSSDNTAGGALS